MTILSKGLETFNYNMPGWVHVYNKNMQKIERELMKLSSALEIPVDDLQHGDIFVWNGEESKWVLYPLIPELLEGE